MGLPRAPGTLNPPLVTTITTFTYATFLCIYHDFVQNTLLQREREVKFLGKQGSCQAKKLNEALKEERYVTTG